MASETKNLEIQAEEAKQDQKCFRARVPFCAATLGKRSPEDVTNDNADDDVRGRKKRKVSPKKPSSSDNTKRKQPSADSDGSKGKEDDKKTPKVPRTSERQAEARTDSPQADGETKQETKAEQKDEGMGPRVKFSLHRSEDCAEFLSTSSAREKCNSLSDALKMLEDYGAAPIASDGKVGGNGAILVPPFLVVSKSGKAPSHKASIADGDFVVVEKFDIDEWKTSYKSKSPSIRPSSDTPLLWASVMEAAQRFEWKTKPSVVLHGHALSEPSDAAALNIPISHEETLFSTPDDLNALMSLYERHPFPENKIFIRRGHGFTLLAEDTDQMFEIFERVIVPYLQK